MSKPFYSAYNITVANEAAKFTCRADLRMHVIPKTTGGKRYVKFI